MATILHPEHWQMPTRSALLGFAVLVAVGLCAADGDSLVRPYYDFVYWVSRGRAELALEEFADDAVVIAGPGCTESVPCIGRAAIREGYFPALFAGRTALPMRDLRFDGRVLRTNGETLFQDDPPRGTVRVRGGHAFEFRGGLISSLRVEFDASDPATADFLKRREAVLQGAPTGSKAAHPLH